MDIAITGKINSTKERICDIIKRQKKHGRECMEFTGRHKIILFATVTKEQFIELSTTKEISKPIAFYEYKRGTANKDTVQIAAEVNVSKILDTLVPYDNNQLADFEKRIYSQNGVFNSRKELIDRYMKSCHIPVVRYCEAINNMGDTHFIIKYIVLDANCVEHITAVK